ncbi:putative MATE family efflux protein [Lachnospiraceae bacterium PFB1-21]
MENILFCCIMELMEKDRLEAWPVPKLVITLALPAILAQIINVLYNIIDRVYIGRIEGIGEKALTGVGVTFPILILVSAFAYLIGSGGAPLAAIEMGKGDKKKAEAMLGNAFTALLIISVVLTVVFQVLKRPILLAFGASEATLGHGLDYLSVYLLGTGFVQLSLGLNPFINCQGKSKTAMFTVLIGALLNIVLDPLFIFGLKMGVKGAALATIISQAVSALFVVVYLSSKKSNIRLRLDNLRPKMPLLLGMMALGVSPFIMQFTESLINVVFNSGLQKYGGDYHVGAMTIIQSVMQMIFIVSAGLTQGIQPIISYNFGARKDDRVRQAYRIAFISITVVMVVLTGVVMLFPSFFGRLFTDSEGILQIVRKMLPLFVSGMMVFGIQQGAQCAFVGLGEAKLSFFLACLRKVILIIPLALVLPKFIGVLGIYLAEPISDVISATTAGILFKRNINKIFKRRDETS